ncbi:MAG TPA: hypothetical protein VLZ81_15135 [Blastocatellia bacterium]|nr:hypothetical protein [Blastocatellia bacterium]
MSTAYYCSRCGAQAIAGMNYCKQCGEQLGPSTGVVAPPPYRKRYPAYTPPIASERRSGRGIAGLAWATAIAAVGGLSVILGTAIPLVGVGMSGSLLAIVLLASIAMLGGTVFMLIRQMSRLISAQSNPQQQGSLPQSSLPSPYPPQISTGPMPMASVTEGTTRIFDPAAPREGS